MVLLEHPPKMVYDTFGKLVEVTIHAEDFAAYLQQLMEETDWEDLPTHLQDAVDLLLIHEVQPERETAIDLKLILADG